MLRITLDSIDPFTFLLLGPSESVTLRPEFLDHNSEVLGYYSTPTRTIVSGHLRPTFQWYSRVNLGTLTTDGGMPTDLRDCHSLYGGHSSRLSRTPVPTKDKMFWTE